MAQDYRATDVEIEAALNRLREAWRQSGFDLYEFTCSVPLNAAERLSLETDIPHFKSYEDIKRIDEKLSLWDGSKLVFDTVEFEKIAAEQKESGLTPSEYTIREGAVNLSKRVYRRERP